MPAPLIASRLIGESGMMWKAGGLGDQPAGLWLAARRAGMIDRIISRASDPDFKLTNFSDDEMKLFLEIQEVQMSLQRGGAV